MDKNLKVKYVKVLEYEQSQRKKYKEIDNWKKWNRMIFLISWLFGDTP